MTIIWPIRRQGRPRILRHLDIRGWQALHSARSRTDARGVMYGGLDVAEQITLAGADGRRAQAWCGLPAGAGPEVQHPFLRETRTFHRGSGTQRLVLRLDYWRGSWRFLAYNRYNMLTFWNSHPYDRMVRLAKYRSQRPAAGGTGPQHRVLHKLFGLARDCGIDTRWSPGTSTVRRPSRRPTASRTAGLALIRDYQKECVRALLAEYPS